MSNEQKESSVIHSNKNTICVLDAPMNGKVYLVGTAHFSLESQKEVAELIQKVQPNRVVLELCPARSKLLDLDEETLMREYKEMDMNKTLKLMRETSVINGLLNSLLIRMYGKITEELGLAPGGEFRVAYKEAMQIVGCKVILGDRPISITFKRAFYYLPWYRKLKLAWHLISTDYKLTKEDIEKLKQSDILEALTKEFGATFPEFKTILIDERDMYLTCSLRNAYQPIPNEFVAGGFEPAIVVGVIGLGHMQGIKNYWNKDIDLSEITKIHEESKVPKGFGRSLKLVLVFGTITVISYQLLNKKFR